MSIIRAHIESIEISDIGFIVILYYYIIFFIIKPILEPIKKRKESLEYEKKCLTSYVIFLS